MGLLERIDEIENRFYSMITEDRLEEAAQLVFDNADEAIALAKTFIPDKAEFPLRLKFGANWPCGSGCYYSKEDQRRKEIIREKIFGWEHGLLSAQNKRRVKRLFDEAKPKLEKIYGKPFSCREELAVLNGLFKIRSELIEKVGQLKNTCSRLELFNHTAERHPGVGWEETRDIWRSEQYRSKIVEAAAGLVGILKDVQNPMDFIWFTGNLTSKGGEPMRHDVGDSLLYSHGHWSIKLKDLRNHRGIFANEHMYDTFAAIILAGKAGNLDFRRALNLTKFSYAEQIGIQIERDEDFTYRWFWADHARLPQAVKGHVDEALKRHYWNRMPGDHCSKFMDWFSKILLKRWEATAVDHERWFSYHYPNDRDISLINFFYHIRDGKEPNEHKDERASKGRLPAVLRLLVEDGVIKEEDIQPPLKKTYLLPNQLLSSRKKLLTDGGPRLESLFEFTPKQKPKMIATSVNPRKLLPDFSSKNLPVKRDDFAQLAMVLDPGKEYYVLYKGNHTLFLAANDEFPSGAPAFHDIRRLTLIPEGAEPEQGFESSVVEIKGQKFLVRNIRSHDLEKRLRETMWSTHADLVAAKCYTFVVDCTPEEFAHKYMKDMLAHVQFFGPGYTMFDASHLAKIDELLEQKVTEVDIALGWTGNIHFRTFEVANKFAFQIICTNEWHYEENVWIAYTVKGYVEDVGLGIHAEVDIDEHGRAEVKRKLEDRAFFRENIEWVKEQLKGPRLLELFLRLDQHEKYDSFRVGKSYQPCEHCGQDYIDGGYYLKREEQWIDHVFGKDMHALSCHPETYVERWGTLRKIVRMIKDANEVENPVKPIIFEYPELMPEFEAFALAYDAEMSAGAKGYAFWESTCGGINAEEEELEDNEELRKLCEEERRLNHNEWEAMARCAEALEALQAKYDSIQREGKIEVPTDEDWKVKYFWATQVFYLQLYKLCQHKLLTDNQHGVNVSNLPTGLRKG
ncbi:hypothetical protein KY326_01440 [Candidatus Woesearchaeota archaeon]|nr:hypothetical protein [Candidatus Woesearchaeota archaeon]